MAARLACDSIAALIRTPILYIAAYVPAAVVMQTPGEFRRRSLERMVEGTITVMKIQKYAGAGTIPAVDWVMSRLTDMCDSDFYFFVLPIGFWLGNIHFFRWLTMLTTIGVFIGAMYKDLYRLPRPPSSLVWRTHVTNDATNAKDYGYVSTHTTNAVTNAGGVIVYLLHTGALSTSDWPTLGFAVALACLYPLVIAFTRMYLGLHSPQDVFGGAFLGFILLLAAHPFLPVMDAFLASASALEAVLVIFGIALTFIVAHPQPRPATVTFLHDCEMMGLAVSCAFGCWLRSHDVFTSTIASFLKPIVGGVGPAVEAVVGSVGTVALMIVVGLASVGVVYILTKTLSALLIRLAVGVDASAVRKAIESTEAPQESHTQLITANVVRRLQEEGDPHGLLDCIPSDFEFAAAEVVAFKVEDDEQREAVALGGTEAGGGEQQQLRARLTRSSSGVMVAGGKAGRRGDAADVHSGSKRDGGGRTSPASLLGGGEDARFTISYTEVPIRIVPDETPFRGLEMAAAGAVKFTTYVSVGVAIVAIAPAIHFGLGLQPSPYI